MPKPKNTIDLVALAAKAKEEAERRFNAHDKERKLQERQDRTRRDYEQFSLSVEAERLLIESAKYRAIAASLKRELQLTLEHYKRQNEWENISSCSWLPNVEDTREIQSFLTQWKDEQEQSLGELPHETLGYVTYTGQGHECTVDTDKTKLIHDNTTVTREKKHWYVDHDLQNCCTAATLTQEILKHLDIAMVKEDKARIEFHTNHLLQLFEHILETIDKVTATTLQHLDFFLEDETVIVQRTHNPFVKLGIWAKVGGSNPPRSIDYTNIGIAIEGKEGTRLSRQLQLFRFQLMAIRVVQLGFDPMSVRIPIDQGQEYIVLDCVLIVDHMEVPEQPALYTKEKKKKKEWTIRQETMWARKLKKLPFPPPPNKDSTPEKVEPVKVRFEVPEHVVVRHRAPMVGAWNWETMRWDPYGTDLQYSYDRESRRATFLTEKLGILGIIQEKGFDVPYEQWSIKPLGYNQVKYTIECRRRNEISDREISILIQNNLCRVLDSPDKEHTHLKSNWFEPPTLLRLLASSGYNLMLSDADAEFTPNVLPKTAVLENRAYHDIANFCSTLCFASTHHNKFGEDRNMCLFRISKDWRRSESDDGLDKDAEEPELWNTIRYEKERCAITKANEQQKHGQANLANADGKEAHLNLYMLMSAEIGDDIVETELDQSNVLVRHAMHQLLMMTRPLTWG